MFNLLKNKKESTNSNLNLNEKTQGKNAISNSNINENTREKFILKGWIESNRKTTCTKKGTRGFLFGSQTPSKMDFSLGRSMVEMLGVLAIIGVLSIGGISGYTIAMRKYRANEITSLMSKYALVLYSGFQNKLMNDPNFAELEEWNDSDSFKKISQFYHCTDGGENHDMSLCFNNYSFNTSSGLGGLPSGVSDITPYGIAIAENGSSVILLVVEFQTGNEELCKQINLLLGDEYKSDKMDNSCVNPHPSSLHLLNGIVVDTDH